ncbi:hypothetical protein JNUCC0626_20230 [Lentzea sp. JNUCC 0626]|uniref:hypothetical protein n=1 Tax=Lentzea sp. JNUCC 0626 TaxID=3367513 RepID=UPI003748971D
MFTIKELDSEGSRQGFLTDEPTVKVWYRHVPDTIGLWMWMDLSGQWHEGTEVTCQRTRNGLGAYHGMRAWDRDGNVGWIDLSKFADGKVFLVADNYNVPLERVVSDLVNIHPIMNVPADGERVRCSKCEPINGTAPLRLIKRTLLVGGVKVHELACWHDFTSDSPVQVDRHRFTADGEQIVDGMTAWDGHGNRGTVDLTDDRDGGWFFLNLEKGGRSVVHPYSVWFHCPTAPRSADVEEAAL